MRKDRFEKRVMKIAIIISIIMLVLFLALIPVSYSLSIGWAAGAFSALLGYSIGIFLINKFFSKKKTKTIGFWIGWLRFYINLALQAGLFIAIIAIDKAANGHSILGGDIKDIYSPINIFTYMGGVGLILISTLVAQFLSRKEGNNGSNNDSRSSGIDRT